VVGAVLVGAAEGASLGGPQPPSSTVAAAAVASAAPPRTFLVSPTVRSHHG
jgi:hypothetical protein